MSILSRAVDRVKELGTWFTDGKITEAEVLTFMAHVKDDVAADKVEIAAGRLKAIQIAAWITDHSTVIVMGAQEVLTVARVLGIADPRVGLAVAALQVALDGIKAFSEAEKAGTTDLQSVKAGYQSVKQAELAHAQVALAIAA